MSWTKQGNIKGPAGVAGEGVPSGGAAGQILAKASATDYDSQWLASIPVANGGTGATTAANARSNLGITPANIGAAASSHTHNYAGASSAGGAATTALACTGNAATATKLATARTVRTNLASTSAVSFDGAANIAPGVTGTLPVANGGTGVTSNAAIGLKAYPVGAVYISYVNTSPASLFGGTWAQLTGRFLRMANDVNTGGSDTHTLSVAQMPSHTHAPKTGTSDNFAVYKSSGTVGVVESPYYYTTWGGTVTAATGGGGAHNNMPAYQDLYAWRRTA